MKGAKTVFVIILTVTWLIDRVTKYLALEYLNGFHLFTVYRNYGITFDILKDHNLVSLFLALSGIGLFLLALAKYKEALLVPGTAFLLGGALGNLTDRLLYGYVVDWIHVLGYINLADIWLCIGMLLLLKKSPLLYLCI